MLDQWTVYDLLLHLLSVVYDFLPCWVAIDRWLVQRIWT